MPVEVEVHPFVGDPVAREEFLRRERLGRPLGAEHANAVEGWPRTGAPLGEEIVEHGVEPLLWRIPGLDEIVVEPEVVDAGNRDVGIGVRGEEHAACRRMQRDRRRQ